MLGIFKHLTDKDASAERVAKNPEQLFQELFLNPFSEI